MRLSVIMPSLDVRGEFRERITRQINESGAGLSGWELLTEVDDGTESIGSKMNRLRDRAEGDYITGVADDDEVSADYIPAILKGLESSPDVLTYDHTFSWKQGHKSPWQQWANGDRQCPTTFHPINAVARWLMEQWDYRDKSAGEDKDFRHFLEHADKIHGLEVKHLCEPLYHIRYRHSKPEFRGRTYNPKKRQAVRVPLGLGV